MKRLILLLVMIVILTGCGITGRVVQEVEEIPTQNEKDQAELEAAVSSKDVSACYGIETQPTREVCFILLAKELNDPDICNNLLGKTLRESCKAGITG